MADFVAGFLSGFDRDRTQPPAEVTVGGWSNCKEEFACVVALLANLKNAVLSVYRGIKLLSREGAAGGALWKIACSSAPSASLTSNSIAKTQEGGVADNLEHGLFGRSLCPPWYCSFR